MAKKGTPKRGRPKADPADKVKHRHVVNFNDATEEAVRQFCNSLGIVRTTDGVRALVTRALKAEGLL
jgi:hypothetical protein